MHREPETSNRACDDVGAGMLIAVQSTGVRAFLGAAPFQRKDVDANS